MSQRVSKNTSEVGRQIWESVRQAAEGTPAWVKPRVKAASAEMVEHIESSRRGGKKTNRDR
jgi:hypothetical protein